MKNFLKPVSLTILLCGLIISSCKDSFLNVPAKGNLSTAQVATPAGVENLLIGAYSALKANSISASALGSWSGQPTNWVYGSVVGQESFKGSSSGDQAPINPISNFTASSTNSYLAAKWGSVYDGINRCNQVLQVLALIPSGDITSDEATRITAEARFLRGFFHLEAWKIWKNVPYIDETHSYTKGNYIVANTGDIMPNIIADFEYAYQNLLETMPNVGRANKWAAYAFEGKCNLYNGDYATALPIFTAVITNGKNSAGKPYALLARYRDPFDAANDNSAESVFAIQASVNDGAGAANANADLVLNYPYGGNSVVTCCGFNTPSMDLANSFRLNSNGLPYLDGTFNNSTNQLSDVAWQSGGTPTRDTGPIDPRVDWVLGRTGVPFLDWGTYTGVAWVRSPGDDGPYTPKKYDALSSEVGTFTDASSWTPGYNAVNQYLMRYSDVLLMAAECEVEAGSLTNAMNYVNQVRTRAMNPNGYTRISTTSGQSDWSAYLAASGNPAGAYASMALYSNTDGTFNAKSSARMAVHMERKLELALEGHRFFDLRRWGEITTSNANGNPDCLQSAFMYNISLAGSAALGTTFNFVAGKNEIFPIPQQQIDLSNGVLVQNQGY